MKRTNDRRENLATRTVDAADSSPFACRDVGRRRILAKTKELATEFAILDVDFPLPYFTDPRDVVPAALDWAIWMTRNGGASLLHARHRDGAIRLRGFVMSNESPSKGKRRFAMKNGVRLSSMRLRGPKDGTDRSLLLSQLVLPALSTNPAHPPVAVAPGELENLYNEVAASLAELTTTKDTPAKTKSRASKQPGSNSHENSVEPDTVDEQRCRDRSEPIVARGKQAQYCARHGTAAAVRERFRAQATKATAGRATTGATGPRPAGSDSVVRQLSATKKTALQEFTAGAAREQNGHDGRTDARADLFALEVHDETRKRRSRQRSGRRTD
jgi:hypothetical protein